MIPFVRSRMKGVISPKGGSGEPHRLAGLTSIEINTDNCVPMSSLYRKYTTCTGLTLGIMLKVGSRYFASVPVTGAPRKERPSDAVAPGRSHRPSATWRETPS